MQYNSIGKQSVTIDQLGRQTSYTYDSMGRLTTTTYPDNTTASATFDAENDRLTSTDRAGHTTSYTYDADKRLEQDHLRRPELHADQLRRRRTRQLDRRRQRQLRPPTATTTPDAAPR